MNIFTLAVCCFLMSAFYATVSDSLRNFFRSRLAFVCRQKNNEPRFGIILKDDEQALQASDFVRTTTLTLAIVLAGYGRHSPIEALSAFELVGDLLIATVLCWIFIGLIPWTLSHVLAEQLLFYTWPAIDLTMRICSPVTFFSNAVDKFFHRLFGLKEPTPESVETFTEEIQSVVDEGEREGVLESKAGKMLHRMMELRQEDIRAVMTPRTDIISIQVDKTLEEARLELLEAGHSRIPVVNGSADQIVGILYARDLLEQIGNDHANVSLGDIVREAFYVPETSTIEALLNQMKQKRLHLAIVLDEYGGVTGLVTLEDILEEIVGDIADEFDEDEEEGVEWIDEHTVAVDARLRIDEMNDLLEIELPDSNSYDTLGGFVFSTLERIPKEGEYFEWNQIRIQVLEASERKISKIQLYNPVPWPRYSERLIGDENNSGSGAPNLRIVQGALNQSEEQAG
ncbi:hemolysin family protein [Thalassoglobus neptunius]|nr:hemolysin family protein [Thalassoglobus neptunius]